MISRPACATQRNSKRRKERNRAEKDGKTEAKWHRPVTPACGKLRQEEASLGYIISSPYTPNYMA